MDLEYFKNLAQRRASLEAVNKKSWEKIVRAFFNLFPIVGPSLEMALSSVDAMREQMIEDAIIVLEDKIGVEERKSLETIEEFHLIKFKLDKYNLDIETLKREYLVLVESSNYYNSAELKTTILSISKVTKMTLENTEIMREQLDSVLKILTNRFGENTTSVEIKGANVNEQYDDEVLVKMGEQVISRVNELIEQNEFNSAHSILDGIISIKGFNERPDELKIGILATKGNIYIKQLDKQNSELIYQQLENIPFDNKKKWSFMFNYGVLLDNETLVEKTLEKLKRLGLSDKEVTIKKSTFYLATNNTEGIINLLGGGHGNN